MQDRLRVFVGLLLVAITLSLSLRAEDPGVPPGLVVGIAPFEYTGARCEIERLLSARLVPYGFIVREVRGGPDAVGEAFRANADLKFVVTGSVIRGDQLTATALVYDRTGQRPQALEANGEGACESLAKQIVDHLGSADRIGRAVDDRTADAERTLASNPNDADSHIILGLAARFRNDWPVAMEHFTKAAEVRPNDPDVLLNLALCYEARGDKQQWLEHLQRAQSLDRSNEGVGIALGNYYLSAGEYEKALGQYERWLASSKNAALVRWNLAVLYTQFEKPEKAIEVLAEIPPSSSFFEEARAWLTRLRNQQERASALSLDASRPRASIVSWLKMPDGVVVLLVTVCVALVLGAILPGIKLGAVDLTNVPERLRGRLRVLGILSGISALAAFAPVLPLGSSTEKRAKVVEVDPRSAPAHAAVSRD